MRWSGLQKLLYKVAVIKCTLIKKYQNTGIQICSYPANIKTNPKLGLWEGLKFRWKEVHHGNAVRYIIQRQTVIMYIFF